VFPLKDLVAFPFMMFPLLAANPAEVELADEALAGPKIIGLFTERETIPGVPPGESKGSTRGRDGAPAEGLTPFEKVPVQRQGLNIYGVGTAAVIHKMLRLPDGGMRLLVQGLSRVRITGIVQETPFLKATIEILPELEGSGLRAEAQIRNLKELFERVVDGATGMPDELKVIAVNIEEMSRLVDFIAANLALPIPEKQEILEESNLERRIELVTMHLLHELNLQEMHKKIQSEVQSEIDKSQRDYILRQQIKAIQKELGEGEEMPTEIAELEAKIRVAALPPAALEAATRELDRLKRMSPGAAEYTVARTYIDWLLQVPWKPPARKPIDLARAEVILNEDHYDLERVKERILEYLAVRRLRERPRSPILCLVGPPGVGKTSLGKSVARALDRPFTRLSLGGVQDEAEIRGHRRTYVGAMPGRIVTGLVQAKAADPVFVLDEIDKVGLSYRGDPTSALLEVLDPEQNTAFSDNYLNLPVDLSQVIFITTANMLDTIPPPLRDRMEVIELDGYSAQDKLFIARRYLIPRALDENGLTRKNLRFTDAGLARLIQGYTLEAGVRNLERELHRVARKVATKVARRRSARPVQVTVRNVPDFLGPEPFFEERSGRKDAVGVATGMAWTPVGGTILFIEATRMPGNRNLVLTGQLGEVMRESAIAALSYLRTWAPRYGISDEEFNRWDIHIHVPAGAMPKDGPSAGVAMFTALTSLFTGLPVRRDTAMTGELTLRGQVLPIGGVRQKVLGAHRAGIKRILLPKANERDLEEVSAEVKKALKFHFVDDLDDVLDAAFAPAALRKAVAEARKRAAVERRNGAERTDGASGEAEPAPSEEPRRAAARRRRRNGA
jgi:ATP-dependent Lon protease